ncbi:MAG: SURF1 family protein [Pseudomonadota bacterium]|nr:SURF1 family protein [Pseudomonadota bacterium]
MNRAFQPRPFLYMLAVPCFALLCGLGVWQLQRLAWKKDLLAAQAAREATPALDIDSSHALVGLADFTGVRLSGDLDLSRFVGFFGRTANGRQGQDYYAPLTLADQQVVWIKLGWRETDPPISADANTSASTDTGLLSGTLPDGQAYRGGWRGNPRFDPGNQPERDLWAVADPAALSAHVGLDPEQTLAQLVELTQPLSTGGGFLPTPTGSELRNPHLSYAVQWFSFAALLALFVALLSFPRRPEKDPAP